MTDAPRADHRPSKHRSHEAMLLEMQFGSFGYFGHELNPEKGLIADKSAPGWPASIAAMGMALTAWTIGVERGYKPRAFAVDRTLAMLRFLMASEQSESPTATGYRGFYYHFLDMETGQRAWQSELSSIDTALLIAGVLAAQTYFKRDTADEREVRALADAIYRRVDWRWMQHGDPVISHGWRPGTGFLPWDWHGYNEALILYLLALGSPTHPLSDDAYAKRLTSCEWQTVEGIDYLHAGPLFIHQMSHIWVDFRGIRDAFMRERQSDYFENSRRAAEVQQRYAIRNPRRMAMYGEHCWGITASDGPGSSDRKTQVGGRTYFDYVARGVPDGPDDGTLAPWAVVASLPFAPRIVLPTIEHFQQLQLQQDDRYGFKASFNATFPGDRRHPVGWVSKYHFGINEGPTVMMIENHLSGMVWRLMRQCPYLVTGLKRAGFEGGWLAG